MTHRGVFGLLKRPFFQRGYIDNQLPPVIIGVLIIIGVVALVSSDEQASDIPAAGIYLAVALGLACIAWGTYLNLDSLKYSESPFNKPMSPWIIAAVAIGGLGHAGWTARGGPLPELSYLLAAAIVTMVLVMAYAGRRRRKRPQKRGLP